MNMTKLVISSTGTGMQEALDATEKLGVQSGLGHQEILKLRLLSEELIGLLRGIAGDVEAEYLVGQEGKAFELQLKSEVPMDIDRKSQLLSVASSGKNAAAKGFMGRLRSMIGTVLLSAQAQPEMLSLGLMSLESPGGFRAGMASYNWSLQKYRTGVEGGRGSSDDADEAWDELEKSIVANIADEVRVGIVGRSVEITITKAF